MNSPKVKLFIKYSHELFPSLVIIALSSSIFNFQDKGKILQIVIIKNILNISSISDLRKLCI